VVATDFFQFFLALGGAVIVAWYAVRSPEVGGLHGLVTRAQALTDFEALSFVPLTRGEGLLGFAWSAIAGISATTFLAYVFLQWWAFRRSDGGGEFIQRLVASKNEAEAEKAAWLFNVMHYVVRTWPWVLVALAALVIYPDLADRELGYPLLMTRFLPVGVLGLVVASLLAAFMSTVSTQVNWGASYLSHDLYRRFLRPAASQRELVWMGRVASVAVTALGAAAAFYSTDVTTVFRLVIAIGTGPGAVLILRWFWRRINAWAELASMLAGFFIGLSTTVVPVLRIADFGLRLLVITGITTLIWVTVMLLTPPESEATLRDFYRRVRPGGPGWRREREATGLVPSDPLGRLLGRTVAALLLLYGLMFAVGSALLLRPVTALVMCGMALLGLWLLRRTGSRPVGG
jgi:Na+/proline symporter